MLVFILRDAFGRSLGHDSSATTAAFGSEVDYPVGLFDHVHVMFDHENGIAEFGEAIQNDQQFSDVIEMQTGGQLSSKI